MKKVISSIYNDINLLTSRKNKAYYVGWLGHGNLGDEALYQAFSYLFRPKFDFYTKPYSSLLIKCFMSHGFDYVFMGGGTLLNRGKIYYDLFSQVAGKKKVVFGTGVANPEYWLQTENSYQNPEGWSKVLNDCDYLGVRGPISKDLLEAWGVRRPVQVIGDPALIFAEETISPKPKRKILGVNVGKIGGLLWGGDDNVFIEALFQELVLLGDRGWSFKFFPVCESDVFAMTNLMPRLSKYRVDIVKNYLDAHAYLTELKGVDVFVGEKLHSVILAACSNTPVIMLEYRPKCRDFMASIEMEARNIKTNEVNRSVVVDMVESLFSDLSREQVYVNERCVHYKRKLIEESEKIAFL